ncbi:2-keto-4-pentenoate hydratase [Shewanella sp. SG41-4]|uniref:2-keto-4-pentenoate hydratase n=1 Tax=Shewanella sp. SG41-4 TaxID=2760976 RepID=UPI001600104F|nr:2-keto-4-pentenoate hydratase [Shewanella sp. SG41-4]MBB1437792.1 2-keto-4-pentenoate hydratase [Shewanella sp. SG41-4]
MTNNLALTELAAHLFAQRNITNPHSHFASVVPQSIDDAIQVQQLMASLNGSVAGWKCLVPQANGQLIVAPILADAVMGSADCGIIASMKDQQAMALIEPEIAFILGQDIEPHRQYSNSDVDQAISSTHMALELIQNRFNKDDQPSFYQKLADGLSNQGVYIGPEIDKSVAYSASHINVSVIENDNIDMAQRFAGEQPCQLPQSPLYWLINYLSGLGVTLKAGQAIITGSYCGVVKVPLGQKITIEYQDIGQFDVTFFDGLSQ